MRIPARLLALIALLLPLHPAALLSAQQTTDSPWQMQTSNTTAGLRGIHAVNSQIAWASGTNGTVLRTTDGGQHWQPCATPPNAAKIDFRGIWAWDAKTAIVMSSGPGALSRLYKTTDACAHWKLLFTNPDKNGFWDAIAFLSRKDGYILGDPTPMRIKRCPGGGLQITLLSTFDGGDHWDRQCQLPGELNVATGTSAFAASNTALTLYGQQGWFGVGGEPGVFVYVSDYGAMENGICNCVPMLPNRLWFTRRAAAPLAGGTPSSGVFSLAFRNLTHGIAVGGDYTKPNDPTGTAAWTIDGGQHWTGSKIPPHGYRSAVAWDATPKAWIAAGTNGSDISFDDGKTWRPLDNGNWNALSLPWVVGPNGRIARLTTSHLPKGGSTNSR